MEPDEQSYHCGTYRYRPLRISHTRKDKQIIEEPKTAILYTQVNLALEVSEISKGEQMDEKVKKVLQ